MRRLRAANKGLVAAFATLAAVTILPMWGASAETATPGIAFEGWFALNRPQNPSVDVPCAPPATSPTGCGPVSPAPVPAPQSPATGAYVVSTAGGDAGRSTTSGDTGWAAFQWDLFTYLDVTVDRFVVTLSKAPDNRGDFGTPVFQGCNIVAPWGAEPGPNPWADRPLQDCAQPVIPTLKDGKYVFDVTRFAQTWVEGTGYGLVIVPGRPDYMIGLEPFQHTFAGYYSTAQNADQVRPVVDFQFTPAFDTTSTTDTFGSGSDAIFGNEDFGGGDTSFEPNPTLDVIPSDVGSPPVATDEPTESAGPPLRRAAADTGFPLSALMLLPLALLGFWGVGTALGAAGDPYPTRKGGVSRMLDRRRSMN